MNPKWITLALFPAAAILWWVKARSPESIDSPSTRTVEALPAPKRTERRDHEDAPPTRDWMADARRILTNGSSPPSDTLVDFTARWFADAGPDCLEHIRAEPPRPIRNEMLKKAIAAWASGAPEDALDWLTRFPETPLASQARSEALKVWAIDDPSAAAGWFETTSLPSDETSIQKKVVMGAWTRLDVQGALEWLNQESDPHTRGELARQAAISGGGQDRKKIASSVMTVFPDPWNEPSMETLLRSWFVHQSNEAETWMASQQADAAFVQRVKEGIQSPDAP